MTKYMLTFIVATNMVLPVANAYRDLETGTFLTRDPIGYADGPNIYCYVDCNPVSGYDPTGLWGVMKGHGGEVHQYITRKAMINSGVGMNWWQRRDMIDESAKEADLTLAHLSKKNTFQHSTALGDWSAKEVKDKMMAQAEKWYTKGKDDGFGKLLHMTQDSFAPSHTERNEKGEISAFLNYYEQIKKEGGKQLHTQLDTLKGKDGKIRPEIELAIKASRKLIQMQDRGAEWDEVKKFLEEEVFILSEDAMVYEGKDFENLPLKGADESSEE